MKRVSLGVLMAGLALALAAPVRAQQMRSECAAHAQYDCSARI